MDAGKVESVTEELKRSGLPELIYPQYRMVLMRMAEMADAGGGRAFTATHMQIFGGSGEFRRRNMTPELVAEMVFTLVKVGIVDVVTRRGPVPYAWGSRGYRRKRIAKGERTTYRFVSYERLVERAEDFRRSRGGDHASSSPRASSGCEQAGTGK